MAATQQAKASDSITKTIKKVGEVSAQNTAASRQTALAIKQLSETSEELAVSVETFKVDEAVDAQVQVEKKTENAGAMSRAAA